MSYVPPQHQYVYPQYPQQPFPAKGAGIPLGHVFILIGCFLIAIGYFIMAGSVLSQSYSRGLHCAIYLLQGLGFLLLGIGLVSAFKLIR